MEKNYYEILELPRNASAEKIEAVARQEMIIHRNRKNYAPDAAVRSEAERHFELLVEIKAVLTDPVRRARYDATLGGDEPDEAPKPVAEKIIPSLVPPLRKLDLSDFRNRPATPTPTPTPKPTPTAPSQPPPVPPQAQIPTPIQTPMPEPRLLTLAEIIPGTWSIQLSSLDVFGVVTQVMTFTPQWQFNGYQVNSPRRMSGTWNTMGSQLMINGQEMTFWPMTQPFGTVITFNFISPAELSGTNSFSEQTMWRRAG
jgi:DnaJ domain